MMKRAPSSSGGQFTSRRARIVHAFVFLALVALAAPAGRAAPPPATGGPSAGACPGQYALPRPGPQYPVWSKGCRRIEDPARRLACAELLLDDWARLDRYAAANRELAPPKPGEPRRVHDDSITDLWSLPGRSRFFPGKPYVNRGVTGQTTPQMLVRFRQDVIALKPRVVVIHGGTNDLTGVMGPGTEGTVGDNLTSMTELAMANGIRVVLASVTPVCDARRPARAAHHRQRPPRPALNEWIAAYARRTATFSTTTPLADGRACSSPSSGRRLHLAPPATRSWPCGGAGDRAGASLTGRIRGPAAAGG
jgi:hypothetical protein